MSITFNDKNEALKYIKTLNDEGYEAYYIKKNGQFIVRKLGRISDRKATVYKVLEMGGGRLGGYWPGKWDEEKQEIDESKGLLMFSKGLSTTGRAHEVGHLKLGHHEFQAGDDPKETAKQEIEAQIYAMSKMDRPIDYKIVSSALFALEEKYPNLSREEIRDIVDRVLDEKGIEKPPRN